VLPDVYLVGSSELSNPGDCMVYFIDCTSEWVLIDAGVSADIRKLGKNLTEVGGTPDRVSSLFITHAHIDHIGGAASFQTTYGTKILAHILDCEAVEVGDPELTGASMYNQPLKPCQVDTRLTGEKGRVIIGTQTFQWLHIPGHTPGSIAILLSTPHGTILFAQDVHGPFLPQFHSSITDWARSMKKLLALDFNILAEGHFGIYKPKSNAVAFIQSYLAQYGY
jgi:glyoxylase-like metal-dependent hydrolase (beta-lactamase superfamily II)